MIIAGIVSYEPDLARLRENIVGIASQVDEVIVYDNGSSNVAAIGSLIESFSGVELKAGRENVGIACALNRIAKVAVEMGASWLLTLDQDSVCPRGMVAELKRVGTGKIGIVTPYIVDRNKLSPAEFETMKLPPVEYFSQSARRGAITSGSLVNLTVWETVGGYDERFFIDYVDYDFNQRVMDSGHLVARTNGTYILHEVGKASRTWLLVPRKDLSGHWHIERFHTFGHSAQRCYYKGRNRVLFTRKHGRRIGITHEGVWQLPQQIVLTVLFESDRLAKLQAFLSGIRDGFRLPLP